MYTMIYIYVCNVYNVDRLRGGDWTGRLDRVPFSPVFLSMICVYTYLCTVYNERCIYTVDRDRWAIDRSP